MPIVALGMDLMEISRLEAVLEKRGERFLERVFTPGERAYCERRTRRRAVHYAGRYAVKEAVMKVLGTGWARGVRWRDIEVARAPGQAPGVLLHGESAALARRRGIERIHVTITHDAGVAAAVAIAEGTAASGSPLASASETGSRRGTVPGDEGDAVDAAGLSGAPPRRTPS